MDTKVNYIIVGLFVALLTLAVIGGTIWLAGVHSSKTYRNYITYMSEPVSGLSEKAPVKFNGVDVGFVDKISLNRHNPQQVRLKLKVQDHTPITQATRSSLQSQGITGIMFIGLTAEQVQAPPLVKPPNEPYPVILSRPSLLFRLDQTVQTMADDLTSVTKNINDLFDAENKASFKHTLLNLQKVTETFDKNSKNIDQSLQSLRKILDNGAVASDKFPKIIAEFQSTLVQANEATKNLSLLSKSGTQSLQDLSQQTLPTAQQVMVKLKHSLDNIEQLTGELNKNPAMLLRGRTPSAPGPGEK